MISIKKKKKRLKDTRCEPRVPVSADIKGVLSVLTKVKLIDISNRGALAITPQRLSAGSIFRVSFAHDDDSNDTIVLRCKVMRSEFTKTIFGEKGEPIPLYKVGFKFIELSDDLVKELKTFVAKEEILNKKRAQRE